MFIWLIALILLGSVVAYAANEYTNSAHGNTTIGVDRTSTSQYATGHCAHCHEQHASIDGNEPNPDNDAPSYYLHFRTNYTSQTDDFCFDCHGPATAYTSGITNYTYSRTFGGDTGNSVDDIKEAFGLSGSTHGLGDILTKITTDWSSTFNANSNPCSGCHNPHLVQKNFSSYNAGKSALSLPSDHNELWGDTDGSDENERMDEYAAAIPAATYRAPFYVGADPSLQTTTREPDGASLFYTSANGFNLTNFVTYCLDCHSSAIGSVSAIPWHTDHHGKGFDSGGTTNGSRIAPYTTDGTNGSSEATAINFVLSCMDCHEPHGSSNSKLLRTEVNNTSGISTTGLYFEALCQACHSGTHNEGLECGSCHVHGGNF